MFTIDQINAIFANVKSGADFPAAVSKLHDLGVTHFEALVPDGQTTYFGRDGHQVVSPAMYPGLNIEGTVDPAQFRHDLGIHQQGQTDFLTFCRDCAKTGVAKWVVDLGNMTCTYFSLDNKEVLVEAIPS